MPTDPTLTPQQAAILSADRISVGVSAGAGCGKTFVLTQRFLQFLDPRNGIPDPLGRIVAITFTEKAAREMRHRVRVAVGRKLQTCRPEEVPHWLAITRGLDSARISTIHGFCSQLLRTHAVEIGLDPQFSIMEATLGTPLSQQAIALAFREQLERDSADARELVLRCGFEGALDLVTGLARTISDIDPDRPIPDDPGELVAWWDDFAMTVCAPLAVPEVVNSQVAAEIRELLGANEPSHPVMQARRAVLLGELTQPPLGEDPATVLARWKDQARIQGGGTAKNWTSPETYEAVREALSKFRKLCEEALKPFAFSEADSQNAAELALRAHAVARTVADQYAAAKRDQGQLDFDDLLLLTRELLRKHPGIRSRIANGISLLMVDEFQDTDPVQAEIIRHLCGESINSGKLFLVGDAKQSIYRFRKADPHVFAGMRSELTPEGRLPLSRNFRSQPAILKFVNFLFAAEIPDYEPLEPVVDQLSPDPAIEWIFPPPEEEKEPAGVRRQREATQVVARIIELLNDPTPRIRDAATGQLRRVRRGDICLLSRTWDNMQAFERELSNRDIDYYLAGGKAFFAQQEIHDIAFLCRWLDEPDDEVALAGILRSPLFGLTDDTLFLLVTAGGDAVRRIWRGLQTPPRLPETQSELVKHAREVLHELRVKKDRLTVASLISLAIERTGYDAALLCEHLGPRKLANLQKLLRLAYAFDSGGNGGLTAFAEGLRDAIREGADEQLAVTSPEAGDVIRLMTIHQSKGLEFPVVFLVDMQWTVRSGRGGARYHPRLGPIFRMPNEPDEKTVHPGRSLHEEIDRRENEAELIRLLYVAATRARDFLVFSAGLPEPGKKLSPWLRLLAGRFDLQTGLPSGDPYFGATTGPAVSPAEVPIVRIIPKVADAAGSAKRGGRAPLSQFRDIVTLADPDPVPPYYEPIPPDSGSRTEFSVTELMKAIQSQTSESPEMKRPAKPPVMPDRSTQRDLNEATGRLPFDDVEASPSEYARRIGTLTHLVLEHFDFQSQQNADLQATVDRVLLRDRGSIDPELQRLLLRKVTAFADSPLRAELAAAAEVHREVNFRLRLEGKKDEPPVIVVGAIDLLFKSADGEWHLVDYKTVQETDAELIAARYDAQVALYSLAVKRMFGMLPASARLIRLGPPVTAIPVKVTQRMLTGFQKNALAVIPQLRGSMIETPVA